MVGWGERELQVSSSLTPSHNSMRVFPPGLAMAPHAGWQCCSTHQPEGVSGGKSSGTPSPEAEQSIRYVKCSSDSCHLDQHTRMWAGDLHSCMHELLQLELKLFRQICNRLSSSAYRVQRWSVKYLLCWDWGSFWTQILIPTVRLAIPSF